MAWKSGATNAGDCWLCAADMQRIITHIEQIRCRVKVALTDPRSFCARLMHLNQGANRRQMRKAYGFNDWSFLPIYAE